MIPVRALRVALISLALTGTIALAGCVPDSTPTALGEPRVSGDQWTDDTQGTASSSAGCEFDRAGTGLLPDAACTPGAVTSAISATDPSPVCIAVDDGPVSESVRVAVLAAYGIGDADRDRYSIDFLVPRQLGGANDFANLWPLPLDDPASATKAATERSIADAVCGGRAGIQAAQYALASDWTTALTVLGLAR